jgi:HSP20 family protein
MFVRVQRFPIPSALLEPFVGFEREVDGVFDRFLRPVPKHPAVDVAEYENESVVVAEIPGVRKEDLKLSVHDGVLTISGERKSQQLPEKSSWLRNETWSGEFSRSVELPHDVKTDAISAELTDGVLRIVLPKSEEVRPREIAIR